MSILFHILIYFIAELSICNGDINSLQCNGIETQKDNTTLAIPAGVCYTEFTSSHILKCNDNNTMYYHSYSSLDCTGSSSQKLASSIYSLSSFDAVNIICNMSHCPYVIVTTYNNLSFAANYTKCQQHLNNYNNARIHSDTHTISLYVENYCNALPNRNFKYSCSSTMVGAAIYSHIYNKCDSPNKMTMGYYRYKEQCSWNDYWLHPEHVTQFNQQLIVNVSCGMANSYYTTPSPVFIELNGLKCNGIETKKNAVKQSIAAGVCSKTYDSSHIFKCYDNDTMYKHIYTSHDCTGIFSTTRVSKLYNLSSYDAVHIVCNMDACSYIAMDVYQNKTFTNHTKCRQFIKQDEYVNDGQSIVYTYIENYNYSLQGGMTIKWFCDNGYIYHQIYTPSQSITSRSYKIPIFTENCLTKDFFTDSIYWSRGDYTYIVNGSCNVASPYYSPITTTSVPTSIPTYMPTYTPISPTLMPMYAQTSEVSISTSSVLVSELETISEKTTVFVNLPLDLPSNKSSKVVVLIIILCGIVIALLVLLGVILLVKNKRMKKSIKFTRMTDDINYTLDQVAIES